MFIYLWPDLLISLLGEPRLVSSDYEHENDIYARYMERIVYIRINEWIMLMIYIDNNIYHVYKDYNI